MESKRTLTTQQKFQGLLMGGYVTTAGGMVRSARAFAALHRMPVSEQIELAKSAIREGSSFPFGISIQETRVQKFIDKLEKKA